MHFVVDLLAKEVSLELIARIGVDVVFKNLD
jgi:hypothetical protein